MDSNFKLMNLNMFHESYSAPGSVSSQNGIKPPKHDVIHRLSSLSSAKGVVGGRRSNNIRFSETEHMQRAEISSFDATTAAPSQQQPHEHSILRTPSVEHNSNNIVALKSYSETEFAD